MLARTLAMPDWISVAVRPWDFGPIGKKSNRSRNPNNYGVLYGSSVAIGVVCAGGLIRLKTTAATIAAAKFATR